MSFGVCRLTFDLENYNSTPMTEGSETDSVAADCFTEAADLDRRLDQAPVARNSLGLIIRTCAMVGCQYKTDRKSSLKNH